MLYEDERLDKPIAGFHLEKLARGKIGGATVIKIMGVSLAQELIQGHCPSTKEKKKKLQYNYF